MFGPQSRRNAMATQEFTITLPDALAELVRSKVADGEYDSPSEVIQDGLEALMEPDLRVEKWLREEVGPAIDAYRADPSRAIPIEVVRAELAELYAQTRAAG
ncbi:MAG: ribbon-helix-helix domain-containing protein [Janthinobacterium lividum]